jgi:hypothetical protein
MLTILIVSGIGMVIDIFLFVLFFFKHIFDFLAEFSHSTFGYRVVFHDEYWVEFSEVFELGLEIDDDAGEKVDLLFVGLVYRR